jgi:hypothetical protein
MILSLYVFFLVFPRRQIVICRRFGALCQFHLQGLGVEYWVHSVLYTQPLKMELTEESETSANHNLTPRKYKKEYTQYSKHGKSLKSRYCSCSLSFDHRTVFSADEQVSVIFGHDCTEWLFRTNVLTLEASTSAVQTVPWRFELWMLGWLVNDELE